MKLKTILYLCFLTLWFNTNVDVNLLKAQIETQRQTQNQDQSQDNIHPHHILNVDEEFKKAVILYQKQNFKEAQIILKNLYHDNPHSKEILTNLGLVSYALGNKSEALFYFRSLIQEDPRKLSAYSAIRWIQSSMDNKDFQHETTFLDEINEKFLIWLTLPEWLLLNALVLIFGGLFLVKHWALQKKLIRLEEPPPLTQTRHYLSLVAIVLVSIIIILKMIVVQETKATLVYNGKLPVKSGPSDEAADLFEWYDGFEVKVKSVHQDWMQVTYQNSMTGWVPKKFLFIHQKPFFNEDEG